MYMWVLVSVYLHVCVCGGGVMEGEVTSCCCTVLLSYLCSEGKGA